MSNFYLRQGKSIVETGELRERIAIVKNEMVLDKQTGIQKPTYITVKTTRAKIIGESGREFLRAEKETTQIKKRCFIRNRKDITIDEDLFIRHNGKLYNIYQAVPLDIVFMELRLLEVEEWDI